MEKRERGIGGREEDYGKDSVSDIYHFILQCRRLRSSSPYLIYSTVSLITPIRLLVTAALHRLALRRALRLSDALESPMNFAHEGVRPVFVPPHAEGL